MQDHLASSDRLAQRNRRLQELLERTPSDTILLDACSRKKAADVQVILTALPFLNPDNVRDKLLRTPLHIACSRKDDHRDAAQMVRVLVRHGANVNNGLGDMDGLQPMHMAVLAGNVECVLLLLEEGASVPASDPFRLTPLLLAKLKLENLRKRGTLTQTADGQTPVTIRDEYGDLQTITRVLVTHLANKYTTTARTDYGLSEFLFSKDVVEEQAIQDAITSITDQLSSLGVNDQRAVKSTDIDIQLENNLNGLIEKVRQLDIDTP